MVLKQNLCVLYNFTISVCLCVCARKEVQKLVKLELDGLSFKVLLYWSVREN